MKRLLSLLLLLSLSAAAQEIRRPSTDINEAIGSGCVTVANTIDTSTAMPNAYDASGTSTSSSTSTTGGASNTHATGREFSGFSAASGSYSALTLNINFSCSDTANISGNCKVTYSTDGGTTYTAAFTGTAGTNVAQQTTTVTLSAAQNLTTVRVRACIEDSAITGTATETLTIWDIWTSGTLAVTSPAAPTGLSLTAAANGLSVQLNWTDNATNETSYQINKCSGTSCTPVSYQTGLATNLTSFNDTSGVSPGTVYGYQACAVNSAGTSCSATSFVTTPSVPAAPSGLSLSISNTSITITWTDNATTETNYILQRCIGSGCTPADYQTLGANTTSFIDTSVPGKTLFIYNVLASNAVGRSTGTGNSSLTSPARQPGQASYHAAH